MLVATFLIQFLFGVGHTCLRSCCENCKKYNSAVETFIPWLNDVDEKFKNVKLANLKRKTLNKHLKEIQALKSELSVHFQEYQNIQQIGEGILSISESDKELTKKQLTNIKKKWNDLTNVVGTKVLSLEDLFQTILEFEENVRDIQHGIQRLEDKMCSHDALGDVSCDPVLLDRLKVLLEEAVGMKNNISKLRKFAKVVVQKADEGTDTKEILNNVDGVEKRHKAVTKNLETRCATLSASQKIISVLMDQVKCLRSELNNLDESFDKLRPIARDLKSLKSQLKVLKDIRSSLLETKKKYEAFEKKYEDITKQEYINETKSYFDQHGAVKAQLTRNKDFMNNLDEKDKTHLESKLDTLKSLRIKLSDIRNEYYEVVADDSDLEPLESEILDLEDDCKDIQDRVVVYSASTPQVWGSINGLLKVDSAFHPRYIGSINEYQACFGS
ncbi:dystonin [Trichonephila clavipes]|nr:dystonin [Trichonephila clavipes]